MKLTDLVPALAEVPFETADVTVYRIDADHCSYFDNADTDELAAVDRREGVALDSWSWTGTVPPAGVVRDDYRVAGGVEPNVPFRLAGDGPRETIRWGTGEHPDEVAPCEGKEVRLPIADRAPEGWTGRTQRRFRLRDPPSGTGQRPCVPTPPGTRRPSSVPTPAGAGPRRGRFDG